MKLSQIGSILKTNKMIAYFDDGADQWIGDGTAFYCVRGMPRLSEEQIYTLFDVPQDKRDDYIFTEIDDLPEYDIANISEDETPVKPYNLSLGWYDTALAPVQTPNGLLMLESKYLKPFRDEKSGRELYMRSAGNMDYFAVKSGMFILGIIKPYRVDPLLKEQIKIIDALLNSAPPAETEPAPSQITMIK